MRRRRSQLLAAIALAFVLTACSERSRVHPNAAVRIEGRAVRPDGAPLGGRPVRMGHDVTGGEVLTAVLTLGLSCAGRGCGGHLLDTTTTDDGSFAFALKGRQTQSLFGEARRQIVSTSAAPSGRQVSGAAASARFRVQIERVRLPTLRLVDPGLAVLDERDVNARWATEEPGPYELTVESDEIVPVWRVTTTSGSASLDRRVLELPAGRMVVGGRSADEVEGSDVELRWRSPGVAVVGVGEAPPSRGRGCRYLAPSGRSVEQHPCALTDGELGSGASAPPVCPAGAKTSTITTPCERPTSVEITLARPVPAELLVVRGCGQPCAIAVSADGSRFDDTGAAASEYATVALPGRPITAVRLGLPVAAGGEVREVSVWGPRPERRASTDGAAIDHLRDTFSGGRSGRRVPRTSLLLAAALLVAVLVAGAFAVGRRSAARATPAA